MDAVGAAAVALGQLAAVGADGDDRVGAAKDDAGEALAPGQLLGVDVLDDRPA